MYMFPNAVSDNVRGRMRGARCTAGKTATQREPVQARPVREAHQETAVERRSVERRPAGCAESAREMVPDEATQKETGFGARAIVS